MKFFTTEGPAVPGKHYYLPPKLNEEELLNLINQEKYFILHAPRQTGKTTSILNFAKKLNDEGNYTALYVNVEAAQAARSNFKEGILTVLKCIKAAITKMLGAKNEGLIFFKKEVTIASISGNELADFLQFWASHAPKRIILFIDEIDSLVGDTLISVLRQLRAGYINRPTGFPQSVCLIGVRDVRDYRIWSDEKQAMIQGGSTFNIKAESLRLDDFNQADVRTLYLQHTKATGQKFTDEALEYAFHLTQGQPWLVNALAYQACFRDVTDRKKTITKDVIERAKDTLILRQDTHLDVLIDRLNEDRIRNIIDTIINDNNQKKTFDDEDVKYAYDLGLIKYDAKNLWVANPIYQEILPRVLSAKFQRSMSGRSVDYILPNGLINMKKLLAKFTDFYRENSADWLKDVHYKESGPHLLMMAFLQRIINGGGKLHREYALGRGRVDLLVEWMKQRIVIELKVHRDRKTIPDGLKQTAEYMDTSQATEGHLIVFDRSKKPWSKKIFCRPKKVGRKTITVWGI